MKIIVLIGILIVSFLLYFNINPKPSENFYKKVIEKESIYSGDGKVTSLNLVSLKKDESENNKYEAIHQFVLDDELMCNSKMILILKENTLFKNKWNTKVQYKCHHLNTFRND